MKKVLSGIVILGLAYGGTTYYFGGEAEQQVKHSVKVVDSALKMQSQDAPAPKIELAVKDYDKGFFNSTAKLDFKVDLSSMPKAPPIPIGDLSYSLPLKIEHGPFILSIAKPAMAYATSSATFPEKMQQMAKSQLSSDSTLPELNMSLLINLDSSARFDGEVPEFTLAPKRFPGKFVWKGMNVFYNISKDMAHVDGETVIKGFDLNSPFANAQLSEMKMDYDVHASKYGLWTGQGSLNIPSINIASAQGSKLFELSSLGFNSSASIDDDLLALAMQSKLEKMTVKGAEYGPLAFKIEMKNMDAEVFAGMQQTLQELNNAKYLPKERTAQLLKDLDQQLPKLVARGTELSLSDFSFKLPEGLIEGNFNAKVLPDPKVKSALELANFVQASGLLKMPVTLVKSILVKQASNQIKHQQMVQQLQQSTKVSQEPPASMATPSSEMEPKADSNKASLPKMLSSAEINTQATDRVSKQLQKLLDNHIIVQQGDSYVVKFSFDKGHVLVNGKAVSPDMLQQ